MSWPEISLGEIAEFRNGLNYTKDNEGSGVRVINVKDFGTKNLPDYDSLGELNPLGILRKQALLQHGDIVFVRSNGNKDLVGRSLFVKHPPENVSFSAFCIRARMPETANPEFYAFFFRTPHFRKRLALLGKGTNISNLNQQVLATIKVPNPSRTVKANIVAAIQSYDDLIENNRRRIQLLEQAARLLYKEWFVHLRFPGHEHTEIIDGVPEGWEKKHLSQVFNTQYGFTESATNDPVGPKFLRGTDINKTSYIDWSSVPYCPDEKLDFQKYKLQTDDILVIRMADPGKVAIVENEEKAVFASYLIRLTRKPGIEIPALYLFYVLASDQYQGFISGASGGSTRKSANAKLVVDFDILVPTVSLSQLFTTQIQPMRQQIQTLLQQNANLRKARDLLLPKLMNGEVAV